MKSNYSYLITGTFLLALSIVMFIATFNIEALTDSRVGADFMPKIIAVLIAIMSIPVIVNGFKREKVIESDGKSAVSDDSEVSASEANAATKKVESYISLVL